MEPPPLSSCPHIEQLHTPEGLQRASRAAELVFAAANRPVLGIAEEAVPHCLHPNCVFPTTVDVHVCVLCVHVACRAPSSTALSCSAAAQPSHLSAHTLASGHQVYISVEHSHFICVACDDFVYSRFLDAALEVELKVAQSTRRNFTSSLSPLDDQLPGTASSILSFSRQRKKKKRLLSRSGWTPSDDELQQIAKYTLPISRPNNGVRPPPGLLNLGNSCYMNSVLQAFLNIPPLRHFFLTGQHKPTCTRDMKLECFACAMDQLVCDSYFGAQTDKGALSNPDLPFLVPNALLDIVWRNAEHLATYSQHDAHEFLIAALNLLNSHCRVPSTPKVAKAVKVEPQSPGPKAKKEALPVSKGQGEQQRKLGPISPVSNLRADPGGAFCAAELPSTQSASIVQSLFSGTLQSDVICCTCNSSSPTLEKFYDISLDVDKLTKPASTRRSRAQSPAVDTGNDDHHTAHRPGGRVPAGAGGGEKLTGGRGKHDERSESDGAAHAAAIAPKRSLDARFGQTYCDLEKDFDSANTLQECLARFTEPELLGASCKMHCTRCGTRQEAVKQMSIRTLPPVVCFHFKRFEQSFANVRRSEMVKIDTPVEFPANGLDMSPFLTSRVLHKRDAQRSASASTSMETSVQSALAAAIQKRLKAGEGECNGRAEPELVKDLDCIYDLFAVVNHIGKIDSGHYTAMVRAQGHWFRCDDQKVSPLGAVDHVIRSEEAYLVFYVQRCPNIQI